MSGQGKSSIEQSVGTNFVWRMASLKRKAWFTGVHFAREV